MIWIDRLAVVWAGIVAFICWIGAGGFAFDPRGFLGLLITFVTVAVLPPWLILRGLHWAFGRHG